MGLTGEEAVRSVLEEILGEISPGANWTAIAHSAAIIASGTPSLPLTTKRTLSERLLTLRAAQALHESESAPGPQSYGPGLPT
jgi:hypothetical protein